MLATLAVVAFVVKRKHDEARRRGSAAAAWAKAQPGVRAVAADESSGAGGVLPTVDNPMMHESSAALPPQKEQLKGGSALVSSNRADSVDHAMI